MKKEERTFPSQDGRTAIHVWRWLPDGEPKAVLQIVHGMVEFAGRYSEFASYLTDHGYAVVGNDHLGHGESVVTEEDYGYFGPDGNAHVLADIHTLRRMTQEEFAGIPYLMLGHSMGSFLVRQYIAEQEEGGVYAEGLAGVIVMGTGWQPAPLLSLGRFLCNAIGLLRGPRHRSGLVNAMVFGANNKKFKPARTGNDWLSKDEAAVDHYNEEDWCGFVFTVNAYSNMFKGIGICQDRARMRRLPASLRLFFVSGAEDPIGNFGEGVRKTYMEYSENTPCALDIRLYENDRHEILHETDRDKVYADLLEWLDDAVRESGERV